MDFRYQRTKGDPVRDIGLGSLNDIGLADAREIARKCRNLVNAGRDPIRERDAELARNFAASAVLMTFENAAETYIAQHQGSVAGEFKELRTSAVRVAKRAHVNYAEHRWDISSLSKTGLPHRVPLSDMALAAIRKAERKTAEILDCR